MTARSSSQSGRRAPSHLEPAEPPLLVLVTGIMAAGKSSVAQALAERLPRSVHLRGDTFRRMIVNGRAEMTAEPSDEARAQLSLRYRVAAGAARGYRAAGFSVVYQDVILGPALREVVGLHERPLHLVVLCPAVEVVRRRESDRGKRGYGALTVEALDRVLRQDTPRWGLWLDTSDLSVEETVGRIVSDLETARIGSDPEGREGTA